MAESGITDTFFSKLKEQSFTIILMVAMLIYQNQIFIAAKNRYEKVIEEKEERIDKLVNESMQRSQSREQYLIQQRDVYVEDIIQNKTK